MTKPQKSFWKGEFGIDTHHWLKSFDLREKKKSVLWEKKSAVCVKNGILFPKLFWPTVSKNCSSDWEKLLKFEAEGREFAKILRSLEQFI